VQFDLGVQGLGILLAGSLICGLVAYFIRASATPWIGPLAALGWFVGGLFVSEVMFATATVGQVQPVIDGLAFDESLLGGLIGGGLTTLVTWFLTRRGGAIHGPRAV